MASSVRINPIVTIGFPRTIACIAGDVTTHIDARVVSSRPPNIHP